MSHLMMVICYPTAQRIILWGRAKWKTDKDKGKNQFPVSTGQTTNTFAAISISIPHSQRPNIKSHITSYPNITRKWEIIKIYDWKGAH